MKFLNVFFWYHRLTLTYYTFCSHSVFFRFLYYKKTNVLICFQGGYFSNDDFFFFCDSMSFNLICVETEKTGFIFETEIISL
jgi:hypothetical protein